MAEYVTAADQSVALNNPILFNTVSIPCNTGSVIPAAPGVLTLKGNTRNKFARYSVALSANVQIPTGGALTPIALGITLNGVTLPESVAIITPQAVEEYQHIYTEVTVTVPSCCCFNVSAAYVDGTEDDATVTGTPAITVRKAASLTVTRIA